MGMQDGIGLYIPPRFHGTVLHKLGDDIATGFQRALTHTVDTTHQHDIATGFQMRAFHHTAHFDIPVGLDTEVGIHIAFHHHITGILNVSGGIVHICHLHHIRDKNFPPGQCYMSVHTRQNGQFIL